MFADDLVLKTNPYSHALAKMQNDFHVCKLCFLYRLERGNKLALCPNYSLMLKL